MPGKICTMPRCYDEQTYPGMGVCYTCYHRIYWAAKNYNLTPEKAKTALIAVDEAAIKYGLVNKETGTYTRRRAFK